MRKAALVRIESAASVAIKDLYTVDFEPGPIVIAFADRNIASGPPSRAMASSIDTRMASDLILSD
jgi:hypothetical protein